MKNKQAFKQSRKSIQSGNTHELFDISRALIDSADDSSRASGFLLQGIAFELGGMGVAPDYISALKSYRMASVISPDYVPFLYMARVNMRRGKDGYSEAYKNLMEARSIGVTPELNLAFGHYFESKEGPELIEAKKHYLRAAMQGRFQGFFGYARVSRALHHRLRAAIADVSRIAMSPLLLLLLGRKASKGF
jgi:hypothetical protein